jgi:hypothetical protein
MFETKVACAIAHRRPVWWAMIRASVADYGSRGAASSSWSVWQFGPAPVDLFGYVRNFRILITNSLDGLTRPFSQ